MELKTHKYLDELKIKYKKLKFPTTTQKGAANVARAIGGFKDRQMVKTLIMKNNESNKLFMVLVGGDQNVQTKNLKKIVGSKNISMASPEEIYKLTGYKIGSIPPFAWHPEGFNSYIDKSLVKESELGIGAGKWGNEIIINPWDLIKATNAEVVNIIDDTKNINTLTPQSRQETTSYSVEMLPDKNKIKNHNIDGNGQNRIENLKSYLDMSVTIKGWMYNKRSSGKIAFLQIRDGSGFIQAIVEKAKVNNETWKAAGELTIESSAIIKGKVSKHPHKDEYELQVSEIQIVQIAPEYPIGKKEHGPEFLFDKRDLYLRSKTPWAVLRIRNQVFLSLTEFLAEEGFIRFDTPVLQPTSCEDTTQLFGLKYYDTMMYLSQSGQLYAEAGIMSFGKVYDFGPVFRAEKSKTRHHLSELWMMDAEMAYFDQQMNMDFQEKMIKKVIKDVLEKCKVELGILQRKTDILENLTKKNFIHLKHQEAKALLEREGMKVDYMDDMTTEEEIKLGEIYKLPIFIEDYPFKVKAFYMKKYTEEGVEHAKNSDLIAPEEGREIIGGSQREDDYNVLLAEIQKRNYSLKDYEWYLNIRKYGSVPHSGFGIGLERTLRWITGVHHIRETIPFPRTLTRSRP